MMTTTTTVVLMVVVVVMMMMMMMWLVTYTGWYVNIWGYRLLTSTMNTFLKGS